MKWLKAEVKKRLYMRRKKRERRTYLASKKALAEGFKYDGLDLSYLDLEKLPYPTKWGDLAAHEKLYCEIGTGHGELIAHLSQNNPKDMFIGFEISKRYARVSNNKVKDNKQAMIFHGDAYEKTINLFQDVSLDGIYVLFPDPWHKKRHHKRRPLISSWFVEVSKKLKKGAFIMFATDWDEYYSFVEKELEDLGDLYEIEKGTYNPEQQGLVATHYYKKWVELGRSFEYIRLTKK